jgi:protein PhnA
MAKKKDMSWLRDNEYTETMEVIDANGNSLAEWNSVAAIKDIKVKWTNDIKRWDKFKNIRFTDDCELIESGKMVLRREFFKKI